MKTRYSIVILALFYFGNLISQSDTINRTDDFNCKYGYWKVYQNLIGEPKLIEEGLYGRKAGSWNEYNYNGNLRNQLKFLDGRPHGPAVMYYENGDTLEFGYFTNNRWIGKYVFFYPGNKRQHVFFFNDKGKRDGCQLYYHENGDTAREADYVNGREMYGKEFYENGNIKEQLTGNMKRNYDKDGNIAKMIVYKNEKKLDYTETTYHKNGYISEEISYINTKRNGMVSTYYENGKLRWKGAYKNGKMNGKRLFYNQYGKKINEEFVIYSNTNTIDRKGRCIHGKPEGELKVYDSEGKVSVLVNFKNGKPDGNTYYYSNNKLTLTEVYSKGTFVTDISNKTLTTNN